MEQKHLVVYLEDCGCEIVRVAKEGTPEQYFVMRNPKNMKIQGVPHPSKGKKIKETSICQICQNLGVESPPHSSQETEDFLNKIRIDSEKRFK